MVIRRTTVAAEADDLAVLEHEARRRGISLAEVLRDAVAQHAETLRSGRRPRFGLGASGAGVGAAAAAAADEHAPARSRRRT